MRSALVAAILFAVLAPTPSFAQPERDRRPVPGSDVRPAVPAIPAAIPNVIQPAEVGGNGLPVDPEKMLKPENASSTMKVFALLTVISLAPAILLMTTCFVRFIVVFGLLRQAMGTQQLPPNQVLIALSMFLTLLIMGPTWKEAYDDGVVAYENGQTEGWDAIERIAFPVKRFMISQIRATGNQATLWTFVDFRARQDAVVAKRRGKEPKPPQEKVSAREIPLDVLLPAFMLSELKTAFIIGFQLYLPFLVIDMVVSSVLISMGMMMLPPVLVSLPFKLLLFVLVDGWFLVVGMLIQSVAPL